MATISATIITLNEEDNIRACLESLNWCDEIVVIDSYSDDATVEIAEEYTDEIHQVEEAGFSEPFRQLAVEKASGDWVLRIDADELVPRSLAERLQELAERDDLDVVRAPRKNFAFGRWMKYCGWWPDEQILMFRPDSLEISDEIHEWAEIEADATTLSLEPEEENAFYHFSRFGISDILEHTNDYTDIEAEQQEDFRYRDILTEPVKGFVGHFFLKKGYRGGWPAFLLSVLRAYYRQIRALKMLERAVLGTKDEFKNTYQRQKEELLEGYATDG